MSLSIAEARGFLKEKEELLKKGDVVQASEKIYKAAKDTVKILAKTHTPDIYHEAATRGRWTASLLDKVVRAYSERMWEWDVACCPGNEKIKRKKPT